MSRDTACFSMYGHVEADELDAQDARELAGQLGLADAGGSGKEVADRLLRRAEPRPRQLDRGRDLVDRAVLTEITRLSSVSSSASARLSSLETDCTGTRAIFATICSICAAPIDCDRVSSVSSFCAAPASSRTSIALSGRCRSWVTRRQRHRASSASSVNWTPWWAS